MLVAFGLAEYPRYVPPSQFLYVLSLRVECSVCCAKHNVPRPAYVVC